MCVFDSGVYVLASPIRSSAHRKLPHLTSRKNTAMISAAIQYNSTTTTTTTNSNFLKIYLRNFNIYCYNIQYNHPKNSLYRGCRIKGNIYDTACITDKLIHMKIKCKFISTPEMKAYGLRLSEAPLILSVGTLWI